MSKQEPSGNRPALPFFSKENQDFFKKAIDKTVCLWYTL